MTRNLSFLLALVSTIPLVSAVQAQSGGAGGSGSGQFTGLATAPEANLFSGSMSMSVPIQIPPGRKNMTPQLSLSYSSGGGSGPFGYGWSLPLGTIERSTKHGRPRCTGEYLRDFVLSLSGAQTELLYQGTAPGSALEQKLYRARIDESYLEAIGDETDPGQGSPTFNSWKVQDRAGMTYRFGFAPESRVWHKYDRFVLEDAPLDTCEFTSIWALNEIVDPNGNNMIVKWFKDENTLYPSEIVYGGNSTQAYDACQSDSACNSCFENPECDVKEEHSEFFEHPFRVEFKRAPRSQFFGEVVEQSHRGAKEEIHHIINRIEVSYREERGQDYQLIRAYDLGYEASNGRLLLKSVDDDPNIAGDLLPPQTFTYATAPFNHNTVIDYGHPSPRLGETFTQEAGSGSGTAHVLTHSTLMDVNGDGMSDLVVSGSRWQTYSGWNVYLWKRDGGPMGQGGIAITSVNWPTGGFIRREENDGADHGNPSSRGVHIDTVDLTGDGLPDRIDTRGFVSESNEAWAVYPLSCSAPNVCSFASTPIPWPAPAKYTNYSQKSGNTWRAKRRLMDVTGDGLPDYVMDTCDHDDQSYTNCVFINEGCRPDPENPSGPELCGFELAPDATLYVQTESDSTPGSGVSTTRAAYIDFNGDGLPDELKSAGAEEMLLSLNTGRGYGIPITLDTPGSNVVQYSVSPLGGAGWGATTLDFFDVNADGLPDRVRVSGGQWLVQLNQAGRNLGPEQVWHTDLTSLRQDYHSLYVENDKGVKTWTDNRTDLFDFNGDGFVDRVYASANNWKIHLGQPAGGQVKPLLLVKAENGIGGITEVKYRPSVEFDHTQGDPVVDDDGDYDLPFNNWLVTEISRTDGISPPMVQKISYAGGLFDTEDREFRGFRVVTQTDSDGNDRVVTYSQDDYTQGRVLSTKLYAGAAGAELVSQETAVWQWQPVLGRYQVFLAEKRIEEFDLSGNGYDRCVLNRNEAPDPYGRVGHTCSLSCSQDQAGPASCGNAQAGQIDTITTFADPRTKSSLRERPLTVETTYVNELGQTETLALKEFYYDDDPSCGYPDDCGYEHDDGAGQVKEGNVRRVRSMVSESPTAWTTVWNTYDAFGNITKVTDPEGHSSESYYNTAKFSLYPSTEKNPLNHWVYTETDLAIGKPTLKTGPNGESTRATYDRLGRVLCETGPGTAAEVQDCTSANARKQYSYHNYIPVTPPPPFEQQLSYVEVRTREPGADGNPNNDSANDFLVSRQYTDGLGRKRIATTQLVVGETAALSTVVAEHIDYGTGGRVAAKYVPYVKSGALVQAPSVDKTVYDYTLNDTGVIDPRGRAHIAYPPDATHPPGQPNGKEVVSYYEGRRTRVLSAQGTPHANAAHSIEDDFGRVIRKESYEGSSAEPTTWFENTYDGMGRVLEEEVSGDASTLVLHTYDLLGREVELTDPDSGTWSFKHDDNGNVLYRDDPKSGQHVQWLYDPLGRVTHVCAFDSGDNYVPLSSDCGSGTTESLYTYDSTVNGNKGIGRVTRVDDLSGFEEFVYDLRGRVVEQTRSIGGDDPDGNSSDIGNAVEVTIGFAYDQVDRVKTITYPDAEAAGGQVVHQVYNAAGQPFRLHSGGNYVASTYYDLLGRLEKLVHGNGVEDIRQYFTFATENRRPWKIRTTTGAQTYLDLEYNYNKLGKINQIIDHRNSTGELSNTATYTYDALGRLRIADLAGTAYDDTYNYNAIGNITLKGGESLTYGSSALDCGGQPLAGPHHLGDYGDKCFSYNDNGERTQKENETYSYDALGRLTQVVTEGGETVDYRYDYNGRRTAKRVTEGGIPGAWTRYFSDAVESEVDDEGNGWLIKHYFAGEGRIAMMRQQSDDFVDSAEVTPAPLTIPPWVWVLVGFAIVILLLNPGKGEIQLGILVGPARAMGTALLVLVVTAPAATTLTGCTPKPQIQHYHFDHLGSTQVVTNPNGGIIQQVRYEPYGTVRGRFNANGGAIAENDTYRHEFTGYETELESGLQYAGARYYDPEVGQFLSHDPKRQFASPYAYGPGDPVNGTDPDGQFWEIIAIIVIAAIAAGVDAYRQTGSFKDALKAAGMSLAMSAVTMGLLYGGSLVVQSVAPTLAESTTAATAFKIGMAGYGAYGVVQSAREGNYASALVGAGLLAYSAYGIAKGANGQSTSQGASGDLDDTWSEHYNPDIFADGKGEAGQLYAADRTPPKTTPGDGATVANDRVWDGTVEPYRRTVRGGDFGRGAGDDGVEWGIKRPLGGVTNEGTGPLYFQLRAQGSGTPTHGRLQFDGRLIYEKGNQSIFLEKGSKSLYGPNGTTKDDYIGIGGEWRF